MVNNRKQISQMIRKAGRMIIGVFDGDPPFMYTIGNWGKRMPEILVIGRLAPQHHTILNIASRLQNERGRAFEHGEIVSLGEGARFPVKFVDATGSPRTARRSCFAVP